MTKDSAGKQIEQPDAAALYAERCAAAERGVAHWSVRERWLSHARLLVFVLGLVALWGAFGLRWFGPIWLAPLVVLFIALVVAHDQVIQRKVRNERRQAHYEWGIARLEDRWSGLGESGQHLVSVDEAAKHLYAADLDLFGTGSLFELLCTTRTPAGERALADWLLCPSSVETIRERQLAVDELRQHVDLREDLALLGDDVRSRLDPGALLKWGAAAPQAPPRTARVVAAALTSVTVASAVAWLGFGAPPGITFLALAAQAAFAWPQRQRVAAVTRGAAGAARDLRLLGALIERLELERESAESPRLASLMQRLETSGRPASARVAQLQRHVDLLEARRNQFFAPISLFLMWGTHFGLAIDSWRFECGPSLGDWIDAAGEIEAIAALAGYAFEHPGDPFPEVVEDGPVFDGRQLGHPLLAEDACVRNDLALDREAQACIVSGSNMSGKSTLLRSVGVNTVLALAGAPVRAESLRLSPLAVGASIRINDSLQEGTSRFYAEIKRLHHVVQLCDGERPLLFLLDEILHGTNSHDRRIGADAIVRGLLRRGAIGLVTTHDLALAQIADELAPAIRNVHFEDHLEDGKMVFDYALRTGVVRKSNALALMRAVGLELPES